MSLASWLSKQFSNQSGGGAKLIWTKFYFAVYCTAVFVLFYITEVPLMSLWMLLHPNKANKPDLGFKSLMLSVNLTRKMSGKVYILDSWNYKFILSM